VSQANPKIYWTRPTDLFLPQSIELWLLRARNRGSDTRRARRALRTVEHGPGARTASKTAKGRRRYARWGISLTHSNLSPTASSSARSQPVSFGETSQGISGEQLSRGARWQQRTGRRRDSRCRWRSQSVTVLVTSVTLICASGIAIYVAFPCDDARAPAERVQRPTCLEVKNRSARLCICARNLEVLTRRT